MNLSSDDSEYGDDLVNMALSLPYTSDVICANENVAKADEIRNFDLGNARKMYLAAAKLYLSVAKTMEESSVRIELMCG